MDPSIMKLLEEDEDETMHSGADVEAFTAALNRDIEGDTSTSQPSDSDSTPLSQGSNHTSSQLFSQWQTSSQDETANGQNKQVLNGSQQEQHSSQIEPMKHGSGPGNQHQQIETSEELNCITLQQKQPQDDNQQRQFEQNLLHLSQRMGIHNAEKNPVHIRDSERTPNPESESQHPKLQVDNSQAMEKEHTVNPMGQPKQVPFGLLLPVIKPQLDKDRAMQLESLYLKLRRNEISKDVFVRNMRAIVGDQMLKMAVYKLQSQAARNSQIGPNQFMLQSQASEQQQNLKMPPVGPNHGIVPQSFPMYGSTGGNYLPFSGTNVTPSASAIQQQPHDSQSQMRHQGTGATQLGTSTQAMNGLSAPKSERQNSFSEPKRMQGGTLPHFTNNSSLPHNSVNWQPPTSREQKNGAPSSMTYVKQEPAEQGSEQQNKSYFSSPQGLSSFPLVQIEHGNAITGPLKGEALEMQSSMKELSTSTSTMPANSPRTSITAQLKMEMLNSRIPPPSSLPGPGNNAKTPVKKPSIGQKKPLEALGSSPPPPSKKQKVSGPLADQSIEQLNDVTAVSGVNLREEEEQLFSGPKEDSRVSEASRRAVQEEEERLLLQKIPLQKKLAETISKCCVKSVSNDVERCLSLCVEERMRGLISNLIRLSKQRVDIEKPRHRTIITSDVRQQMMAMNQKAREEWDKKQAEAEKLQKLNDPEGNAGVDGDKEKDDGRLKLNKANKEEDDKMRATAANVAARAAVGGDDMLSKWQLMAEQARQKREGGSDTASSSQPGKDVSRQHVSISAQNARDNTEAEERCQPAAVSTGSDRKFATEQAVVPQPQVAHSISVKDVIAVLEREPQMSKTTLIYRLYEKTCAAAVAE